MLIFEIVIGLLLVGGVLALWSDRLGVPYPALLAAAGAALALIPGTPEVVLDPELALALFVAPVLLDAAFDASPRDLKENFWPVASLALIAVILTIAGVAFVARWIVPDMSWPVAIALGAIVAPPDASAATAVLRRLRPPHRLVVILEGESLFNDATALLVYRIAVGAAMTGAFSGWSVLPTLLLTCGGGAILGIVLARGYLILISRVTDIPISVLMQFISAFGVWILAEHLGLSAIITVVAYAMTLGRLAPGRMGGRHRIATYAVWDVAVFVLNALAFVLIGLQLRGIITRLEGADWRTYLLCTLAVCLTVILVRIAWVMFYNRVAAWKIRRFGAHTERPTTLPTIGTGLVVSWCGMRGIVTLAAALALPDGSSQPFPYRDLIILCAFAVVLTTLVLQGLTLRPLMERVGLKDDGTVEKEIKRARIETARAALRALDDVESSPATDILRREYEARIQWSESQYRGEAAEQSLDVAVLQRRAVAAQRRMLVDLRARDIIGDDAFHVAEEELDLIEITADARVRATPS
jgi:monovalent cation/hydrogen antiporter